jgi:hypothetical protein
MRRTAVREQAQPGTLDERYGRAPGAGRRSWWLVGAAVGIATIAVAWYVLAGPASAPPSTSSVQADVSASRVVDEHHMGVTFTVSAPVGKSVACAVNAKSADFTIVGWKIVTVAPSDTQSRTVTQVLRTTSEATAGFVDSCWLS